MERTQAGYGPIKCVPRWTNTLNFIKEADALNYRNILPEQHVYKQERSRNALYIPQAGFERAARRYMGKQFVMKFVLQPHKPLAYAERKCGQEWVLWTIKQSKPEATVLNDMKSVASDALETKRRTLLNEATAQL